MMYALFLLWNGSRLRAVEVLEDLGGVDLNGTARKLLEEYRFDAPYDPDSCTIYLLDGSHRLALVGDEVR